MASFLINEDEFCCSICLDLLKEPVSLACGHSFCMNCITTCWDRQPEIYSCPQCRETFDTRPHLRRNNMLTGLVEKLRKTRPQISDSCYAKSEDVECDICTGIKCKAVKSCLVCLASYCEDHFRPHKESSALMRHNVIEASAKLHEKICPQHERPLDVFCRTDQKCICYLCTLDKHADHNTISVKTERAEKAKQVAEAQNNYTQRILERERECLGLAESMESLKCSAQVAEENTKKMFHELIQSIEKKCSEVTNQIRIQEKSELNRAKELLKQVELEIAELKRKNEELKQLSETQDDLLYFQVFQSFHDVSLHETTRSINITMPHSLENVQIFVQNCKKMIEKTKLYPDPSDCASFISVPAPQNRFGFVLPSTPATQSQSGFKFSSPPTTQSQFSVAPSTRSGFSFGWSTQSSSLSGPSTQSGFSLGQSTQSSSLSGPSTQSGFSFGQSTQSSSLSGPSTQSGFSLGQSTQSSSLSGPSTQSGFSFGQLFSFDPSTQSSLSFRPSTQSGFSFGPSTQSSLSSFRQIAQPSFPFRPST